jgi:hypothetical protein
VPLLQAPELQVLHQAGYLLHTVQPAAALVALAEDLHCYYPTQQAAACVPQLLRYPLLLFSLIHVGPSHAADSLGLHAAPAAALQAVAAANHTLGVAQAAVFALVPLLLPLAAAAVRPLPEE